MTMVLWMATMTADAANVQYLTIVVNGKAVSFSLAEHPVITYANNTLVVKTATEEVEIPVASISGYEFEEEPSAVRDLQLGKPSIGGAAWCSPSCSPVPRYRCSPPTGAR